MSTCSQGCSHCGKYKGDTGGIHGWPLVSAAIGGFLMPLIGAFAGTVLVGANSSWQPVAALAGFVLGVLIASILVRMGKKWEHKI
ncbi:MAG: hypothetical protein EOL87_07480 [Spartobacteria bacterium]|nr:hypothetical protein [Spartobacteria bacterium]